jgi:hypothetical protein
LSCPSRLLCRLLRRRQTRLGVYDAMGSHPGLDDSGAFDVKMDERHSESTPALHDYVQPDGGDVADQADGGECEEGFVGSADGDAG